MNNPAPWWGVLLAAAIAAIAALGGSVITNWWGSRSSRREEWFRRVQWAAAMAASPDPRVSAGGLAVLDELANSKLAKRDDLVLLNALNANTAVDAFEQHYAQDVDETTFFADDEGNEDDEENGEGGEHDESGIENSHHG